MVDANRANLVASIRDRPNLDSLRLTHEPN
jgi:hypothetical protein